MSELSSFVQHDVFYLVERQTLVPVYKQGTAGTTNRYEVVRTGMTEEVCEWQLWVIDSIYALILAFLLSLSLHFNIVEGKGDYSFYRYDTVHRSSLFVTDPRSY